MTRTITLLAPIAALALGLSACGSSNHDASTSSTSTSMSSSMPMPMPSGSSSSTSAGSSSTGANAAAAVISIADFAYTVPPSVAPGTKITIKNGDSQAHTVTSKDGGFDVKVDPKGTATITAPNKAGSYKVLCTFHANMSATLVVK